MPVVVVFELVGWDYAEFAVEAPAVEPVDALDRSDLEVLDATPGPFVADQYGFGD
ncbi:hypothetical protein Q7F20_02005 [Curtobacterium sp. A7_M15]|uniref:hypothetical protein n=1 Tax=Curtobacterium sp. A7_M15 TaxID=3065241 RepID=UPI0027377F32|nr:hypothetical protein [Curtobacterium sp. A7_M15]MDP4332131.1 hypothetical protein [Curtobacterium sp. A7_M15]